LIIIFSYKIAKTDALASKLAGHYFHYFAWLVVFTKFSQKNWHSPLDSANNRCYITTRTKERGSEKRRAPKKSRMEVRRLWYRCSEE